MQPKIACCDSPWRSVFSRIFATVMPRLLGAKNQQGERAPGARPAWRGSPGPRAAAGPAAPRASSPGRAPSSPDLGVDHGFVGERGQVEPERAQGREPLRERGGQVVLEHLHAHLEPQHLGAVEPARGPLQAIGEDRERVVVPAAEREHEARSSSRTRGGAGTATSRRPPEGAGGRAPGSAARRRRRPSPRRGRRPRGSCGRGAGAPRGPTRGRRRCSGGRRRRRGSGSPRDPACPRAAGRSGGGRRAGPPPGSSRRRPPGPCRGRSGSRSRPAITSPSLTAGSRRAYASSGEHSLTAASTSRSNRLPIAAASSERLHRRRRQARDGAHHEVDDVVRVPERVDRGEVPAPARAGCVREDAVVVQRPDELLDEERVAAGLRLHRVGERPAVAALEAVREHLEQVRARERGEDDVAHDEPGVLELLDGPDERVPGRHLVVAVGAAEEERLERVVGEERAEQPEARGVDPLQIVEEQDERVRRAARTPRRTARSTGSGGSAPRSGRAPARAAARRSPGESDGMTSQTTCAFGPSASRIALRQRRMRASLSVRICRTRPSNAWITAL